MARVLVVEDEEDIAFPLVRTLEREGYSVTWVEDGATGHLDLTALTPEQEAVLAGWLADPAAPKVLHDA